MTFGGKIMELFSAGGAPQGNPTPPTQGNSNLVNPNINPGANGNPLVPGGEARANGENGPAAFPVAGEGEKSPLDNFGKLWEPVDPKLAPPNAASMVTKFNIDPVKIQEAARAVDFSQVIPSALQARLDSGDKGAVVEALNLAVQAGYGQSAIATSNLINTALEKQHANFIKAMPEILRNNTAQQLLRADNTFFDNPAVSPLVTQVERQISQKNPNLPPAEVAQQARTYLDGFANEYLNSVGKVVGDRPKAPANGKGDTDWGSFFLDEQSVG